MESHTNLIKPVITVSAVTLSLLLIPFIGMQVSDEVNWTFSDFLIMGILLFVTGLSVLLVLKMANNIVTKLAFAMAIGTTFLMIFANLAIGLIGSGPHAGNLMYIVVYGVAIIGTLLYFSNTEKMATVMFSTVGSILLLVIIAFVAGMQNYPASSAQEILVVNGFFAALYTIAGTLFKKVSK